MPVSKKPRAKKTGKTASRSGAAAPALPDRRAMEGFLAAISGRRGDDPTAKAQEVMYEAWEQTSARSRIALARKALSISPLCADAYVLLAEEAAQSPKEARNLYAKGAESGELALGPEGFADYEGHFWGFLETRPYMRARLGLALILLKLGDEEGAVSHFRDMLRLNPNDNQGVRYLLAGCLLRRGEDAALKELLASYEDEGNAFWLYTRALLAFREGGEGDEQAVALARQARAANEHVPAILVETKAPAPSQEGYITMGGPDEATDYVMECGPAWHRTPGAVAWLTKAAATLAPKRRTRPTAP
jgi:tetratricopeptide (TPR) repeat protein